MIQNTASVTEATQATPEDCQGNPGKAGTGPVPGGQAMGNERDMPGSQGMTQGMPGPQGMPQGMAGPQGMPQGMAGPQGMPQGMPGPQGMTQGMPGPQGMAQGMPGYQGMTQGMPGPQGMPQGMAGYQGMTQGMPGYQGMAQGMPGPQGMAQGMPGPQGMAQGMPGPQGMAQVDQTSGQAHVCDHGPACGPGHPKHDAHQYGQFMGLVNDLANGNADASQVIAFLGGLDVQFWKGALVGISTTLLLTNDSVKNAIVGTLSGILGAFVNEPEKEQSE